MNQPMLPNQLLDSPPCRFAAKDPWPVPRCGPWPTNGARSAQACQTSWQNLTIDTPAPHTNHLKVPEEPSRPSTDFFHTQTPRCASWNQDPDLPATRAVPPANTLNTIRVFFSTGTKEGLPVPRLPFKTYTTALPHSLTRDTPHQQSPL